MDLDIVIQSLRGKDASAVDKMLDKINLSEEDRATVKKRLGLNPTAPKQIVLPKEDMSYVMSIANPTIRVGLRSLMLETDWSTPAKKFVSRVYDEFGSSQESLDVEIVKTILGEVGLPRAEVETYAERAASLAKLTDHVQINYLIQQISKRAMKIHMQKQVEEFLNNPSQVDSFVDRVVELKRLASYAYIPRIDLKGITPADLRETVDLETLKSFFPFINQALPGGGYLTGQIVMINAVPGGGKTTWMLNEAVYAARQGKKVFYLSLGDMMPQDFLIKITGIVTGTNVAGVLHDLETLWYNEAVQNVIGNIDISVLPAGSLSVDELYSATTSTASGMDYDVIIVDYDSNLKIEGDYSMYERGRVVYETLSAIARDEPNKLVLVGSQIKQAYWDSDLVPLEAAAESSNKQAVVDVMITLGKNPASKRELKPELVHAGYVNIAKARRGIIVPSSYHPYMLTTSGRIIPISEAEYAGLYPASVDEKKKRRNRA